MKKQLLNWLLKKNNGQDFIVQRLFVNKKSYRILYPSGTYQIKKNVINVDTREKTEIIQHCIMERNAVEEIVNSRQVMPFEVVFDIDVVQKNEQSEQFVNKILCDLENDGLIASLFNSGGKGYHIHLFINELANYKPEDRELIRYLILSKYAYNENKGITIDLLLTSESHMIQMEFSQHYKTMRYKDIIKINKQVQELSNEYAYIKETMNNDIPESINRMLLTKKIRDAQEVTSIQLLSTTGFNRECIEHYKKHIIPNGCRDNALFSLLTHTEKDIKILRSVALSFSKRHDNFLNLIMVNSKAKSALKTQRQTTCKFNKKILEMIHKQDLCGGCIWNGTQ